MIYLVSSKRYPGEFTDRKIEEARRERDQRGRSSIFVYDRTVYDIKPAGTYGAARWSLFLGDATRRPRILSEEEGASVPPEDAHLIRRIPHEFKSEFEHDLLSAIRDIAGCSTLAMNPYLINTEAVAAAFGARPSVLSLERTDFVTTRPAIHARAHRAQPGAAARTRRSRRQRRQRGRGHRLCRALRARHALRHARSSACRRSTSTSCWR